MKKRAWFLFFLLLSGMLCAFPGCGMADDASAARLICLNIGKADCMLLLYDGQAYLIDTGYEQTYPALEAMLRQYGVDHLNGVFLTHCHEDHKGGLALLAQSGLRIDAWYAPRIYFDVDTARHPAESAAKLRNQQVSWLNAGDVIPAGKDGSFTVLGPLSVNTENENNNSLVMRFSSPAGSILFTGDMKTEEEAELLSANAFAPCDVLKAGHHGDNNATGKELLRIVQPKAAVIFTSTREEPDTPAPSALKRLNNMGCAVYVTQDFHDALMLTLKNGGEIEAEDISWDMAPKRAENIALSMDVSQDTLTIFNQGAETLDLNGYSVYSTKGNELLNLKNARLGAGEQLVIGSQSTDVHANIVFSLKRIWKKNKLDMAILYDAWGRPVACTDNGLGE